MNNDTFSDRFVLRIGEDMLRQIDEIIKKNPYKYPNRSIFIRAAIANTLKKNKKKV